MFNPFRQRHAPRVVSVVSHGYTPLPANIDIPPFMRRTPAHEEQVEAQRRRAKTAINRNAGILTAGGTR